jgi:hypothetical protein
MEVYFIKLQLGVLSQAQIHLRKALYPSLPDATKRPLNITFMIFSATRKILELSVLNTAPEFSKAKISSQSSKCNGKSLDAQNSMKGLRHYRIHNPPSCIETCIFISAHVPGLEKMIHQTFPV